MKKFVRVLSVALVVVMLCASLASCSKVSGTYEADLTAFGTGVKVSYDFGAFKKVTMTVTASVLGQSETKTYEGKYEITEKEDDKMEITFTFEDESGDAKTYGGTQSLVIDKENDAIKLNGITFKKAE